MDPATLGLALNLGIAALEFARTFFKERGEDLSNEQLDQLDAAREAQVQLSHELLAPTEEGLKPIADVVKRTAEVVAELQAVVGQTQEE